jgi:Protein of unknown function (DUF3352)
MRFRAGSIVLALLLALLVAACGGGGGDDKDQAGVAAGSVPAGADYVPSTAVAFASLVTDSESSQWDAARELLNKFPGRERVISMVEQALAQQQLNFESDIDPALGAETDVGVFRFESGDDNAVALTQPDDQGKLEALLRKASDTGQQAVFKRIGDWTAASNAQSALDAAEAARGGSSLADNATFTEAMGDLPSDSIARLWLDGEAITRQAQQATGGTQTLPGFGKLVSLAFAVRAQGDGLTFAGASKSDRAISQIKQYSSKLVSQVPAGVLAYLSFAGFDEAINAIAGVPAVREQLGQIQAQLGVTLDELAPLFAGEGALYVRQGIPIPEVTLVLEQTDEAAARTTAEKLFARLAPALQGQQLSTTISGVSAKQIKTDQFSLYYAVFDRKLVITAATTGISGLRETGEKLAEDGDFDAAKDAAGMPDETAGFLYVNLKDAIPLIVNAATSFGTRVDPAVQQNLEPLKSLLFYSTLDGPKAKFAGFLGVG